MYNHGVVRIFCYYGTTWNATQLVCEKLKETLLEAFGRMGMEAHMVITKDQQIDELTQADIAILATSVFMDKFRTNVIRFARKNADLIQTKLSGLIIVNFPYKNRDAYIPAFIQEVGYDIDVSITTGGLIDIEKCHSWLKYTTYPELESLQGKVIGDISQKDLDRFSQLLISTYRARRGE